jgi:hypothetical protein
MNADFPVHVLHNHVENICIEHKIGKFPIDLLAYGPSASPVLRRIFIDPIKDLPTYATALHEIAHVLTMDENDMVAYSSAHIIGDTTAFTVNVIRKEIEAWNMAEKLAVVWTPEMQDQAGSCLSSYMDYRDNLGIQSQREKSIWELLDFHFRKGIV